MIAKPAEIHRCMYLSIPIKETHRMVKAHEAPIRPWQMSYTLPSHLRVCSLPQYSSSELLPKRRSVTDRKWHHSVVRRLYYKMTLVTQNMKRLGLFKNKKVPDLKILDTGSNPFLRRGKWAQWFSNRIADTRANSLELLSSEQRLA